jgi:hypothetical protein
MLRILSRRLACVVSLLAALGGASAAAPATGLAAGSPVTVTASVPNYAEPGESVQITLAIANMGDEKTTTPIVVSDTTGSGLTAATRSENFIFAQSSIEYPETPEEARQEPACETTGKTFQCTIAQVLPPGTQLTVRLETTLEGGASGVLTNQAAVSVGSLPAQTSQQEITVGERGPFALGSLGVALLDREGDPLAQAGAVPSDFTTNLTFASGTGEMFHLIPITGPVAHFKDVTVHLPPGLIGNPTAVPTCTAAELAEEGPGQQLPNCPPGSQVGLVHLVLGGEATPLSGLFNMVPPPGAASELGFKVIGTIVVLDAYVRAGDHGIDIVSHDTSTTLPITNVEVTTWGDPASHSHDRMRGACLGFGEGANGQTCPDGEPETAFLRLPTSCSGEPLPFDVESNSYEQPSAFVSRSFTGSAMSGCEQVPFEPTIFTQPTTTAANSPTGVAVQLSLPQSSNPLGLGESDLKKAVVTLPEGMALNPSAADGLEACDDADLKLNSNEPATCPEASKIGTVLLHTPLLASPIEGFVWLRTQNSSDPMSGEMFRIAIELRDDRHGIDIKLPGQVAANPTTGRLTSTFDDAPQLPFSDMTLHFKSGARAPLTTPFACQPQTTEADLYPWARPNTPVHKSMTFQLTSGPEGKACPSPAPFAPGFSAGVSSVQAGAFTPFLTTFTRSDADQSMQRVSVKLPPGLSGSLASVALCGEAQANAGTCGQASEIGSVTAGAGAGPTPFYVTGGKVFMTGPYEGAPFGLSVVVPAKAGPFDLGTVVVRAKVDVDPHTAQLTVTTDALPQIVGGVPVNLRLVNVTINRPGFTFNPTSCDAMSITGSMTGGQGATAALSSHFQVTNCGALAFKPKFAASTSGKTSKANGASLSVKLTYPNTPQGTEANIAKVKVDLPKQLPSRLTTLQKACLAATFEANPASCPAASVVGHAKAITPILPVPLEGPAYFVSHGGEAFPSLIVVLQGYGVTVDLEGTTFISKQGITSSTFKAVPDVPVGSFELTLPQGKYSALAANGNLCTSRLAMPTAFLAQNGTETHTSTPIAVTGCTKAKAPTRAQKLAKALNACKNKPKTQRTACQQQAHKKYGPVQTKAKKRK